MEALGYMFAYFLRGGDLPWRGIREKSKKEMYKKISDLKK